MFAITAITGKVGSGVADALLTAGRGVRAVVRDAAKGAPWKARGCEVAVADLADADRLARALEGTEGAFILLPPVFDPQPDFRDVRPKIAAIREALAQARPPKAVVLSTIGADAAQPNLLNALRYLEQALADVDLPITFLRAAWFMENAEWDVASARERGVVTSYLQPLDRPSPWFQPTMWVAPPPICFAKTGADTGSLSSKQQNARRQTPSLRPSRKLSESRFARRSRHAQNGSKPSARRA